MPYSMTVWICKNCGNEHVPENFNNTISANTGRNTACIQCGIKGMWSVAKVNQTTSADVDAWEQAHNDSVHASYNDQFMFY